MRHAFVLLPDHLDVSAWRLRWQAGQVPDETPYGYHHAEREGYRLSWSQKLVPRTGLAALPFKVCRRLLGFDMEHVWNNRRALWEGTDVVWTHTEREFLPVLLLSRLVGRRPPALIAQIVWLADDWACLPAVKRWIWLVLLRRASVVTCHSPDNLHFLKRQLGLERVQLVEFGIAPELYNSTRETVMPIDGRAVRVLTMGNDRHRDWTTLASALGEQSGLEVFIASSTYPDALLASNMTRQVCDLPGLRARLQWCDVVVVPLVSNLHASGLTVTLEAVAAGKPVVVTDAGGLTHYFGQNEVWWTPVGDADALRMQVMQAARNQDEAGARIEVARRRFQQMRLDTPGYAHRHVVLSEALLSNEPIC